MGRKSWNFRKVIRTYEITYDRSRYEKTYTVTHIISLASTHTDTRTTLPNHIRGCLHNTSSVISLNADVKNTSIQRVCDMVGCQFWTCIISLLTAYLLFAPLLERVYMCCNYFPSHFLALLSNQAENPFDSSHIMNHTRIFINKDAPLLQFPTQTNQCSGTRCGGSIRFRRAFFIRLICEKSIRKWKWQMLYDIFSAYFAFACESFVVCLLKIV